MNPDLVREVETLRNEFDDRPKPEIFSAVIDQFLSTPGLVGFWPMSSVQRSTGNAYDLSAQGRTLTYNGNPTYNIYNGFVPYIDLDGTGDYLSRADETDLDIQGNESHNAVPGLTAIAWAWVDGTSVNNQTIMSKYTGVGNRTFRLIFRRSGLGNNLQGGIADVPDTEFFVTDSVTFSTGIWIFTALRWTPSTELKLWYNDRTTVNTTSIPATLQNSTASFMIGAVSTGLDLLDGRVTYGAYSANALSDAYINRLFEQSRVLFGV